MTEKMMKREEAQSPEFWALCPLGSAITSTTSVKREGIVSGIFTNWKMDAFSNKCLFSLVFFSA
jgi:hypothetical protein